MAIDRVRAVASDGAVAAPVGSAAGARARGAVGQVGAAAGRARSASAVGGGVLGRPARAGARWSEIERVAGARADDAVDRESAAGLQAADGGGGGGAEAAVDAGRAEVVAAVVQRALEGADADARGGLSPVPWLQDRGGGGGGGGAVRPSGERGGEQRDQGEQRCRSWWVALSDGGRGCGSWRSSPSGERCWRPPAAAVGGRVVSGPPGGDSARPLQKEHDAAGRRHDKTEAVATQRLDEQDEAADEQRAPDAGRGAAGGARGAAGAGVAGRTERARGAWAAFCRRRDAAGLPGSR